MNNNNFTVPVLFLIFNRPETTHRVFQRIREIRPAELFVSADGPRAHKKGEQELCEQTRQIISTVDWDCNVHTRFSETNQGCKIGVSSGIQWFFENVQEGIILEDDCLPDLTFFKFCEVMLDTYRNDARIMHIGGTNFQDGKKAGNGSYYFSEITHIWGWAAWKRAWEKYDVSIQEFGEMAKDGSFEKLFSDARVKNFWKKNFEAVYNNVKDTWDFQWMFTVKKNKGLSIIPNVNLISNIGFSAEATHTFRKNDPLANRATDSIDKIIHPEKIERNIEADNYTYSHYLNPNKLRKLIRLFQNY